MLSDDDETLADSIVDSMHSCADDETLHEGDDEETDMEEGDFFSGQLSPDEQQLIRLIHSRNTETPTPPLPKEGER